MFAIALAMVMSTSSASAYTENILAGGDLTIGSRGEGVIVLQSLLSELGYLSIPLTTPMGYFGTATKSGLARYQASINVSPTGGYFGPISKIAMHQNFASHGWLSLIGW